MLAWVALRFTISSALVPPVVPCWVDTQGSAQDPTEGARRHRVVAKAPTGGGRGIGSGRVRQWHTKASGGGE